ncbi:hypothetical protein [Pedobacter suwonensis]|uniref:hypothetical protein n=1 Tax=Pedobacter suwonensis TaxID=332999 RepID=UPI0011A3157E|nr:hypothetical protein [Pedobacter suwonensis]
MANITLRHAQKELETKREKVKSDFPDINYHKAPTKNNFEVKICWIESFIPLVQEYFVAPALTGSIDISGPYVYSKINPVPAFNTGLHQGTQQVSFIFI